MTSHFDWAVAGILLGLVLLGTFWLAYEMGKQVGFEYGCDYEHDLSVMRERRMWAGDDALIRFANETTTDWSNK